MEPIKITDKLTLRQEALRLAVELSKSHVKCVGDTIHNAGIFEDYLKGKSELPEYEDTHKDFKEMLAKMQESFKPNPWVPADSEIRPAKDMPIVTKVSDSDDYFIGKYNETGWIIPNAPNGCSVVCWMPIPPFTQPTL